MLLAGTSTSKLEPAAADGKPFPFMVDDGLEKLILNAPSEEVRRKTIEVFNLASKKKNWKSKETGFVTKTNVAKNVWQVRSSIIFAFLMYIYKCTVSLMS